MPRIMTIEGHTYEYTVEKVGNARKYTCRGNIVHLPSSMSVRMLKSVFSDFHLAQKHKGDR